MTCVTQTRQEKGFIIHSFIHSFNSTRFNEHFCVSGMILGTSDEQLDNGPSLGVNISTRNNKQVSQLTVFKALQDSNRLSVTIGTKIFSSNYKQ